MTYAKVKFIKDGIEVIGKVKRSCWSESKLFVRYFFYGRRHEEWIDGENVEIVEGCVL